MSAPPPVTGPQPANSELVALAVKARPDWTEDGMWAALARAHNAFMTWGQIYAAVGRLLADPTATPADLAHHAPESWRVPRVPSPSTAHRGAALARAALATDTTDSEGGRAR